MNTDNNTKKNQKNNNNKEMKKGLIVKYYQNGYSSEGISLQFVFHTK